jgi:hypothetical protein
LTITSAYLSNRDSIALPMATSFGNMITSP